MGCWWGWAGAAWGFCCLLAFESWQQLIISEEGGESTSIADLLIDCVQVHPPHASTSISLLALLAFQVYPYSLPFHSYNTIIPICNSTLASLSDHPLCISAYCSLCGLPFEWVLPLPLQTQSITFMTHPKPFTQGITLQEYVRQLHPAPHSRLPPAPTPAPLPTPDTRSLQEVDEQSVEESLEGSTRFRETAVGEVRVRAWRKHEGSGEKVTEGSELRVNGQSQMHATAYFPQVSQHRSFRIKHLSNSPCRKKGFPPAAMTLYGTKFRLPGRAVAEMGQASNASFKRRSKLEMLSEVEKGSNCRSSKIYMREGVEGIKEKLAERRMKWG